MIRNLHGLWYIRLNISSMRFVITKPPETFTKASNTDAAPSNSGTVLGRYPPPMMKKPPMPTIPYNAIRG